MSLETHLSRKPWKSECRMSEVREGQGVANVMVSQD